MWLHPQLGDAARSLGKDGLRMKSDDDAAAVAVDDAAAVARPARDHEAEAAYLQQYEARLHVARSRHAKRRAAWRSERGRRA